MGSGKKTQQLEAALRQGTGGKTPLQMPLRGYNSLHFRTRGALPSAPCSLLLPAIFLYGYIKLAETRSTVLTGRGRYNLGGPAEVEFWGHPEVSIAGIGSC